jgi:CDP-diacylglycerol--serine O-phosphatidyltransferase
MGHEGLGKFGWAAAFAYCACAALRLARFNTNIGVVDKRYFQGLPSPAAAALVAGFVWAADTFRYHGPELDWFAVAITALAAFTMVSDIRYWSGKDINIRKSIPFWGVVVLALGVAAVFFLADNLPEVLFIIAALYALSGYALLVAGLFRPRPPAPPAPSE